ncbi:Protein of unknown function DUF86 [Rhodopseudomonas palustris HaA2]|uniref:DUF86 domain-containing protein n=1 Tax=Rhodopseudomonas palustris (strain HaA2) TaxID=316058 RepID=Q2IU75_RHOP2|nr:DUF86 domain-containing protein [Rhodopseudomonas palustris]ABD08235.1 Protein of unknown function DUF86 [Rhodopseudomonas palustris HaA2]
MPPSVDDRFRDILDAIAELDDLLQGYDFEKFSRERRTRLLTERLLEIVCEASRSIPDAIKQGEPTIDWRSMIDFGNLLRHAYHSTRADTVWEIIRNRLPPLQAFAERRLHQSGE